MSDFKFLHDLASGKWVVMDPYRSLRPNEEEKSQSLCPFEHLDRPVLFEQGGVRVVANQFPFAPIHELIIHSHDHDKSLEAMEIGEVEDVFKVLQERFNLHKNSGQVFIFNNTGEGSGESLPHPHTQLAVIPNEVKLEVPVLSLGSEPTKELTHLYIFCPSASQWPGEVWVAPKREGRSFGESDEAEIQELSSVVQRLIAATKKENGQFPYNFYIYPGTGWYLRFIPRSKILGGFEIGTGIMVNTKEPSETFEFLKNNF